MIFSEARRVARIALALALVACGDYSRNSPFDPNVVVTLRIEGPDTLTAIGESIQLTLRTDPPYAHEPPVWHAVNQRGPAIVAIDQTGRLTILSDPGLPDAWTPGARQEIEVTAELAGGRRRATTTVYFTHRVAGLRADDCEHHQTITLDSLRPKVLLCATYVDPLGVLFERTPVSTLYATSRDTSIVATVANVGYSPSYTVERRGLGSTWVVLRTSYEIVPGTLFDSVFVTVADTVVPQATKRIP